MSNQWLHSPSMPRAAAADYVSTPDISLSLSHEWVVMLVFPPVMYLVSRLGQVFALFPQQTVAAGKVSCYNVTVCDAARFHSLLR